MSLTALYRHFDADGVLLYVGISLRPAERLSAHAKGSRWADRIAKVTVQWLPDRRTALEAEAAAIVDECPRFNIIGRVKGAKPTPFPRVVHPQYVEQMEAVAAHFKVSLSTVQKMVRDGMPREQISSRKYRYELGAIKAWCHAKGGAVRQKRQAERQAKKEAAMEAARDTLASVMERAIATIGTGKLFSADAD